MNERIQAQVKPTQKSSFAPSTPRLLQRKCACGGTAGISGKCEECSKKKRFGLQTKLKVNKPGDSYEREADRFADQFLATPTHHALSDAPPRTQRFGHDFSRVRVHSGVAAEQSPFERNQQRRESSSSEDAPGVHQIARDGVRGAGKPVPFRNEVQPLMPGLDLSTVRAHEGLATDAALDALGANAYTTGSDLGLPANASRRLVAHELAHVAQQRQGVRLKNGIGEEGDTYEVAAGAIADRVASGQSAAELMPAPAAPQAIGPVQLDIRAPRTQAELNEEAVSLAERQAKRREFLASLPDDEYWAEYVLNFEKFRNMLVEFDTYWDKSTKTFRLHSYVDTMEREVVANAEAHEIYRRTLWDRTENKPVKKSWFDSFIGFICEYTNPCKGNMEQFREDRASGMSREEALERGLNRLGLEAMMFLIPGGPEGPREISPSRGLPFKVPAPITGEVGALEKAPVPPRAEPTSVSEPLRMAKKEPPPPTDPKLKKKIEASKPPAAELDPGEGMTTKTTKTRKTSGADDDLPKKEKISDRYDKPELENSPELKARLPLPEHRSLYLKWLQHPSRHYGEGHGHIIPGNTKELDASLQEFSLETGIKLTPVP